MKKFSWRELQTFAMFAEPYLRSTAADTKLRYAITRVMDQVGRHHETINQAIGDLEIDNCVTDDKDVIQRDSAGNLQFTREGLKRRNALHRALVERADLEIEPHIVPAPKDLAPIELAAFDGLVIDLEKAKLIALPGS